MQQPARERRSAYSYGIAGDDNWGCQISRRIHVPVHQYDYFDPTRPACPGGDPHFHDECVGGKTETIESRFFDTVANQISKNGDAGKTLIVKMDVEGAELDSIGATSNGLLDKIDQLVMELHGTDTRYLTLVKKLRRAFVPVHLHFKQQPVHHAVQTIPSSAYEVTFVNERITEIDRHAPPPILPSSLDVQNTTFSMDCQAIVQP